MITHPIPVNHNPFKDVLKCFLILLALIFAMAMMSCNSENHFLKQAKAHPEWLGEKDSVSVLTKIVKHDSLITVKGDNIYKDSIIEVAGPYPQVIKAGHNTGSQISVIQKHDTIFLKCKCDSLEALVSWLSKENTILKLKTYTVPQPKPSFWDKALEWYKNGSSWFTSIILLLLLVYSGGRALGMIEKIHPKFPF